MNGKSIVSLVTLFVATGACAKKDAAPVADTTAPVGTTTAAPDTSASSNMTLSITSPAFADNTPMAAKYTCEGGDTSPPLAWSGAPAATKSFALIVEDPDAPDPAKPTRVVTHWVLYNIPSSTTSLAEGAAKGGLPTGSAQGMNERKAPAYMGPCPPIGSHRYFFKLSALDTVLTGLNNPTKADLEKAMQGHVIGSAQIIGTYQKAKK